jgi:hypothetical protein
MRRCEPGVSRCWPCSLRRVRRPPADRAGRLRQPRARGSARCATSRLRSPVRAATPDDDATRLSLDRATRRRLPTCRQRSEWRAADELCHLPIRFVRAASTSMAGPAPASPWPTSTATASTTWCHARRQRRSTSYAQPHDPSARHRAAGLPAAGARAARACSMPTTTVIATSSSACGRRRAADSRRLTAPSAASPSRRSICSTNSRPVRVPDPLDGVSDLARRGRTV